MMYDFNMAKYFVFDTETGGLKTKTSLLSVYGILVDEYFMECDVNGSGRIDLKIKPDDGIYNIDIAALKVNSIDLVKHDNEAKPLSRVKTEFKDYICRCVWSGEKIIAVGHCVDFDISFAEQYLMPPKEWRMYFEKRHIDTASVALFLQQAGLIPKHLSCSLSSLVEHFRIDLKVESMHDAKVDALACLEVLKKMSALVNCHKSIPMV